ISRPPPSCTLPSSASAPAILCRCSRERRRCPAPAKAAAPAKLRRLRWSKRQSKSAIGQLDEKTCKLLPPSLKSFELDLVLCGLQLLRDLHFTFSVRVLAEIAICLAAQVMPHVIVRIHAESAIQAAQRQLRVPLLQEHLTHQN